MVIHLLLTLEDCSSNPESYVGKDGSFLPMADGLQYRTLTNCMYWFSLSIMTTNHDTTYIVLKVMLKTI